MSRLDDELKIAFRRQEPSPDFTARLIERINSSPAPRPDFRQRLAAWFSMPRFRWVAIGATAVLLIAIGVGLHQTTVKDDGKLLAGNRASTEVDQINEWGNKTPKVHTSERPRTNIREPRKFRPNAIAVRREPQPSPEAEAAKERVLFALQIAGATLNDAQRAIQDDGPKDKPEPLNNR